MGQYHLTVCLDTREYLDPHGLGDGLKLAEQIGSDGGVGSALIALLAVSNGRGGGDLPEDLVDGERIVGRWGGKRIAIVGDYAEPGDYLALPGEPTADAVYGSCHDPDEEMCSERPGHIHFRDITPLVARYLGEAAGYTYVDTKGWVERFSLWSDVAGLSCTFAGPAGRGRVAIIDGKQYWERDVVAALGQLSGKELKKRPVPLAVLSKHGVVPIMEGVL